MNDNERQLQDFFRTVRLDDAPDPQRRDALERRLLATLSKTSRPDTRHTGSRRTLRGSRIIRVAAAAVIATAVLVPLTYGTSVLVTHLIGGSYGYDEFTAPFRLDRNIHLELEAGTKQHRDLVSAGTIRFFVEDGQIRGTLRCQVMAWPKYAWHTRVELFDHQGKSLAHTESVTANAGVEVAQLARHFNQSLHVSLGSADRISDVRQVTVCLARASQSTSPTPPAWVESEVLPVAHGQVTDAEGMPIASAVMQIREQPRPGQRSITAPDVLTDARGFYCYDQIDWPYHVGALVYEPIPSGKGVRHQYRSLNKVLEGTQHLDFAFGPFPVGSAILSGTVIDPNGTACQEFTIAARLETGGNDDASEYRCTYGHQESFTASDGRFEIRGLPAGAYNVWIKSAPSHNAGAGGYIPPRRYACELREGQETEIDAQNATEKVWYGRVLFEDGTPAASQLPQYKTQVVAWERDDADGVTVATADSDGCFAAPISDEGMQRFLSGKAWLTVSVSKTGLFHGLEEGTRVPLESLSLNREEAGVIVIERPQVYYGRILYENGRPAVPPAAPWPGARVGVRLQASQPAPRSPMVSQVFLELDKEGYFTAYLTNQALGQIRNGQMRMQISHPSYTEERHSSYIGLYPVEMLATRRDSAKSYTLAFAEMPSDLRGLRQYLDSAYNMEELAAAVGRYRHDHDRDHPNALEELARYTTTLAPLTERIAYLPPRGAATELTPAETVLAYDRMLLNATSTTHVLFLDGHIEFCRVRQLRILGIEAEVAAPAK